MWPKWTKNSKDETKGKSTEPKTAKASKPAATPAPVVDSVVEYKQWVAKADALDDARASQVTDPMSNPDTVNYLRRRARETSLAEIDARHEERLHDLGVARRHRRIDTAAAESELEHRLDEQRQAKARLARIRAAREATDPATAAAEMIKLGRTYVRKYLVIAWVASALAAVGLGAYTYLDGWGLYLAIAAGTGGEIVLTFLITQIIAGRAELHRRAGLARDHEGTLIEVRTPTWARLLPWIGIGALLLASIGINIHGLATGTGIFGFLGALGAAIATLCTLLSWGYSEESAAATTTLLSDAGIQAGEDALDEIAAGARIPRHTATGGAVDRDAVLDAIADDPSLLDEVLTEAADRAANRVTATAPQPRPALDDEAAIEEAGAGLALEERPAPLLEGARRAARVGEGNRDRVRRIYRELVQQGGEASISAIARKTGLDRRTVRRHLGT